MHVICTLLVIVFWSSSGRDKGLFTINTIRHRLGFTRVFYYHSYFELTWTVATTDKLSESGHTFRSKKKLRSFIDPILPTLVKEAYHIRVQRTEGKEFWYLCWVCRKTAVDMFPPILPQKYEKSRELINCHCQICVKRVRKPHYTRPHRSVTIISEKSIKIVIH